MCNSGGMYTFNEISQHCHHLTSLLLSLHRPIMGQKTKSIDSYEPIQMRSFASYHVIRYIMAAVVTYVHVVTLFSFLQ